MNIENSLPIADLSTQELNAVVATLVAIGTLYCFLGYRTLRFVLGLTGFILAGSVAGVLAGWVSEGNTIAMLISAAIGGIAGAIALSFLYKTGVFLLGLMGGTLIAHNCLSERPEAWIPLVVLGIGFVGGMIALLIERPVISTATAALGAWLVVAGVLFFLGGADLIGLGETLWEPLAGTENRTIVLAVWALLAFSGLAAQLATHKSKKPRNAEG